VTVLEQKGQRLARLLSTSPLRLCLSLRETRSTDLIDCRRRVALQPRFDPAPQIIRLRVLLQHPDQVARFDVTLASGRQRSF
jgi:hypothetical protein